MEVHVHSTLAMEGKNGNQDKHDTEYADQAYITNHTKETNLKTNETCNTQKYREIIFP